ncbi:MAG: phosphotransferase enzyme family protein [Candidatus Methylacidiphilales bacterium]
MAERLKCFVPDVFSVVHPVYSEVENPGELIRVMEKHYRSCGAVLDNVRACGGFGLNSKNFIIRTSQGEYVLKRHPQGMGDKIKALQLYQASQREGWPVPEVILSDEGQAWAEDGSDAWVLLSFVEGSSFTGGPGEVESVGRLLYSLSNHLSQVPESNYPSGRIVPPCKAEKELWEEMRGLRSSWDKILGTEEAAYWTVYEGDIERALEETLECGRQRKRPMTPMHIDLHPHNLLMRDGNVAAILDYDSFRQSDAEVMAAFAALKLLRQAVALAVATSGESEAEVDRVRGRWENVASPHPDTGRLARSEVLRRIFIIVRLSLRESNRSWNHVLPIHLRALEESELLFS